MKHYRIDYNAVAGWIDTLVVTAKSKAEARRKARVSKIVSVSEITPEQVMTLGKYQSVKFIA